jgi:hypothetical protein
MLIAFPYEDIHLAHISRSLCRNVRLNEKTRSNSILGGTLEQAVVKQVLNSWSWLATRPDTCLEGAELVLLAALYTAK